MNGRNDPAFGRSDFSIGSRIVAALGYDNDWGTDGALKTSVSIFYNGQSGEVFSYVYGGRARGLTNQDSRDFTDLMYVPANQNEINFIGTDAEQTAQWNALDAFISQDNYLSTRRGDYAERNGARTPAMHILDLRVLVDFAVQGGNKSKAYESIIKHAEKTMFKKGW